MYTDKQMMEFAKWVSIHYRRIPFEDRYVERSNGNANVPHFDIIDLLDIYKTTLLNVFN